MSMEEKQNSLTFQDFSQSVLKPETREDISLIIQECYKKNIPIEINCLQSKKNIGRNFQAEKTLNLILNISVQIHQRVFCPQVYTVRNLIKENLNL